MFRSRYSDRFIDLSMLVISILGVVMIGSASVGESSGESGMIAITNMGKHIVFIFLGMMLTFAIRKIFKPNYINRPILYAGYGLILSLMLVCLGFDSRGGAKAWIPIFGFTLQPSEFAKIFVMCWIAYYMVDVCHSMQISPNLSYENKVMMKKQKFTECILKPLVSCGALVFVCVFLQNDLGSGVILAGIMLVCFYAGNDCYYKFYQKKSFTILCGLVIVALVGFPILMNFLQPYQKERFIAWLNPLADPLGISYQQVNGLIAFAKNGFLGAGLGNSTQKFGYVPLPTSDYISSIIFEELGIFGLALIIVPYLTIIIRLFKYSLNIKDNKGKIILSGVAAYFFFHLFLNMGGVSGLIPMTGVPLLCISEGGSSTIAAYMAIGLAQVFIIRHNRDKAAQKNAH